MTSANTVISTKDTEILESINEIVKPLGLHVYPTKQTINGDACDYIIGIKNKKEVKENIVTRITGQLGIRCKSEYKDIPELYLYNTVEYRIALLQGLMDADGTVDKRNGSVTYSTSSSKLKESFCQLVRSLGGITTTSVKKTKHLDNYTITVNLPNEINPFRLTRKKELVVPKTKYLTPRYIKNIEYIGQVEQQCIEVDSKDHLYITDNHIVTHNTFVSLATALSLLGPVYKKIIIAKSVTTLPKEEIGFLKGGLEQKMEPFMMSFMWNLEKICGENSAKELIDKKLIMVLPLAFIRGLSIDNAIIIVDEVQNIDSHTFKTLITRIGENSKYIFLGDVEQIDMKKKEDSSLQLVVDIFKDSDIVGTINFEDEDCVRNPIIPKILEKLRERGI
jgi:phosphate starvation-inducible protein PhoH